MVSENNSIRPNFSPLNNITEHTLDSEFVYYFFDITRVENKAINDRVWYGKKKALAYFLILGNTSTVANIDFKLTKLK